MLWKFCFPPGVNVIIWGAGLRGIGWNNVLKKHGRNVICFFDRKFIGNRIDGIDIIYPVINEDNAGCVVLVSPLPDEEVQNIIDEAKAMGFANIQVGKIIEPLLSPLDRYRVFWGGESATKYICAKDFANESISLFGNILAYRTSNIFIRLDENLDYIWMHTAEEILEETFSNPFTQLFYPLFDLSKSSNDAEELDEEICLVCHNWSLNYGHFTFETMDKIVVMEKSGYKGKYMVQDSKHARELIRIAGIHQERIIWLTTKDAGKTFRLKNLLIIEKMGFKMPKAIQILCDWANEVADKAMPTSERLKYPRRLFVKRVGARKLYGADDLLTEHAFYTIIPEELSVLEQIKYFSAADVVFSPHGANSANVIYMRGNTDFIESFRQDYINICYLSALKAKGVNYHMLVAERTLEIETMHHIGLADYSLDPMLLQHTLERIIQ